MTYKLIIYVTIDLTLKTKKKAVPIKKMIK